MVPYLARFLVNDFFLVRLAYIWMDGRRLRRQTGRHMDESRRIDRQDTRDAHTMYIVLPRHTHTLPSYSTITHLAI